MPHFNLPSHSRTPYLKLILIYIFMARDETFTLPRTPVHAANDDEDNGFFSSAKTAINTAQKLITNFDTHKLQIIANTIQQENLIPNYQSKNYTTLAQLVIENFGDKMPSSTIIEDEKKLHKDRIISKPHINSELTDKLTLLLTTPTPNNPNTEIFKDLIQLTTLEYPLLKFALIKTLETLGETNTEIAAIKEEALASLEPNTTLSLTVSSDSQPKTDSTETQPLAEHPTPKTNRLTLTYSSD